MSFVIVRTQAYSMVPTEGGQRQVTANTEIQAKALQEFLCAVEKRAFRMAQIQLRNADDALDAVQDAMLCLARRYATKPPAEWRPLFYRILENRVRDMHRRRRVQSRFVSWFAPRGDAAADGGIGEDPRVQDAPDPRPTPDALSDLDSAMTLLEQELRRLPARQRQAFLLRNFEGMDVAETARAMSCSEGSVKTHYFRAVHALRERLRGFAP